MNYVIQCFEGFKGKVYEFKEKSAGTKKRYDT